MFTQTLHLGMSNCYAWKGTLCRMLHESHYCVCLLRWVKAIAKHPVFELCTLGCIVINAGVRTFSLWVCEFASETSLPIHLLVPFRSSSESWRKPFYIASCFLLVEDLSSPNTSKSCSLVDLAAWPLLTKRIFDIRGGRAMGTNGGQWTPIGSVDIQDRFPGASWGGNRNAGWTLRRVFGMLVGPSGGVWDINRVINS